MISIIISTYKSNLFAAVEKNIAETIGLPFEIIQIDNPSLMSLTEAYNLGAKKAKFENLLFVHDDVIFETQNWGKIIVENLSNPKTGIIGIAGSNYVPVAPSGWFIMQEKIAQNSEHLHKAFSLDGVFMAVAKNHFEEILFNEDVKGFHGYDLDFSLRMSRKYQNFIIKNIELEHLSLGKIEKGFIDNNIQIRRDVGSDFQNYRNSSLEKAAFINFLNLYFKYYPLSLKNIFTTLEFLPSKKWHWQNLLSFFKIYAKIIRYRKSFLDQKPQQ